MLNVYISNSIHYTAENLYQWDVNQTLAIHGLTKAPSIHFNNKKSEKAHVVIAEFDIETNIVTAKIPNVLLEEPHNITAYVYQYDGDAGSTTHIINIPIVPRAQPDEFAYTGEEIAVTLSEINAKMTQWAQEQLAKYEELLVKHEGLEARVQELEGSQ
ncbi:MAG: hypothetical protein IJA32_06530 [Lachnospiraceae bacterium]|nr:hypothetical protein [Lachnospiraceae bacterium]